MSLITLTTDFGSDNWFVGTMKGVIKNINPDAEIVDITHGVRKYNVHEAAFILCNSYGYYPAGTVHTVVVDPGVGSKRNAIIVRTSRYCFVGPDNGVLSYALAAEEAVAIVKIQNEKYLLAPVSETFHGRDVFAPVSAYLSIGIDPEEFGPRVKEAVSLTPSVPRRISEQEAVGHVVYVDTFGNLITDVTGSLLEELFRSSKARRLRLLIRDQEIVRLCRTYSEGKANELIALIGSSGHLEIAINLGSAADVLEMKEGGKFILKIV
jgi:S-adenosylmethionine hydrolase